MTKYYKILKANETGCYHVHGSWFDYVYEFKLLNLETGETEERKIMFSHRYNDLELPGQYIEYISEGLIEYTAKIYKHDPRLFHRSIMGRWITKDE